MTSARRSDKKTQYQTVMLHLSNGEIAFFTGKAFCKKGENIRVVAIKVTEPRDLPEDCHFEQIEKAES